MLCEVPAANKYGKHCLYIIVFACWSLAYINIKINKPDFIELFFFNFFSTTLLFYPPNVGVPLFVDTHRAHKTITLLGHRSRLFRHNDGGNGSLGGGTLLGHDLIRDAIQIALALRRQLAATVGVLLNQLDALQRLQSFARIAVSAAAEVRRMDTVAFAATVHLGDGTNTDRRTVVQMAQDRRASHVEPVWVIGGELLVLGSLDDVHAFGHLKLAGSGRDENNG